MKEKKLYYVELLRVIAIFFVVYNHTRSLGYSLYTELEGGFSYWASLTMSILCKIAVPIFFMISGGLLLGRQESLKQLFSKRILRYLTVILIFTFLQYLRIVRVHPENGFHPLTWLLYCYAGNIIEPYWFLKSYLSMLFILPFLRLLSSAMGRREYLLLIATKAVITVISLIFIYTGYSTNLSFPLHADIIFYPLLGCCLMNLPEQNSSRRPGPWIYAGLLSGLLLLTVLQANAFFKARGSYTEGFHTVYTWIFAALTLLLVKSASARLSGEHSASFPGPDAASDPGKKAGQKRSAARKLICAMGSCAFGVYLIEDVVRNQVQRIVPAILPFLGSFWSGIVYTLFSVLASMAVIYLVRKIPLIRKLI